MRVEALAAFTFDVLASFMKTRLSQIVYLIIVGIIGTVSALFTYFFQYKPKSQYISINNEGKKVLDIKALMNPNIFLPQKVESIHDD